MKTAFSFGKRSKIIFNLICAMLVMSLISCASTGPQYYTVKNNIAELPSERSRLVFYRPDILFGAGGQPNILLDGNKVGRSLRGTIFYVDIEPGKHRITVPAMLYPGETTINIEAMQGEVVYVKTSMGGASFIGRTDVEVIGAEQATKEIESLVFLSEPNRPPKTSSDQDKESHR